MLPMLPRCRWRRPGRAVWLRALYSYRYRADDGRDVAMAAGERLLLLRRATPDWWQVRRPRDPPWPRPFFVPAAYVAEEEPGNSGTQSPETPHGSPPGPGAQHQPPARRGPPSPRAVPVPAGHWDAPPGAPTISRTAGGRQRAGPPMPAGPPLQVLGSWERHRDPESGRCFFYSPESGTSSWKPPRRHRDRGDTGAGAPEPAGDPWPDPHPPQP